MVDATVEKLRKLVLGLPEGTFLGSEEELINQLGISRPTFRQAAQTLTSEQLLTIRRGVGGGYFSRYPSIDAIVHMASLYLYASKTSVHSMMDITEILLAKAIRVLASDPDPQQRQQLALLLEARRVDVTAANLPLLNQLFLDFAVSIGRLSGNNMLAMFLDIAMKISRAQDTGEILTVERAAQLLQINTELAHYIRIGDADFAAVVARRLNAMTQSWFATAADA